MNYDVIIIGAGQAGLSMGYYLQKSNLSFLILDRLSEIGASWRSRYDTLTLFTPRSYSSLPGFVLSGNESIYPTKDEIADYLRAYATKFSLPLQHDTDIYELSQIESGFKLMTNQGEFTTKNVVVATGPFQKSFIPEFSKTLSNNIFQIHSSDYKNPAQLNDGSVLVVGGGNSGAQIAVELSKERDVYLSVGHKMKFLPLNIGKKSIFWYFDKLGIYGADLHSRVGKFIKEKPDPIFGLELKTLLKKGTIKLKSRTASVNHDVFTFDDESKLNVQNVIWSTGFRSDYSWIQVSNILDEKGIPIHQRGITPINGLFFLGLPWQFNRSSALLQGVGMDAEYLFKRIIGK